MAKKPVKQVDISAAVAWAASEYGAVVSRDKNGHPKIDIEKASESPPDLGESYMELAANNTVAFFKDLVPKYLGKADADLDPEKIEAEKKSIAEIRKVLKKYQNLAA